MPTPREIPTSMADILPVVEARLRFITGLPIERVRPWIGEDPPHLQADQDLILRLAGITPDAGWAQGGGRLAARVTERLEAQIRTRLQLDPSGEARIWYTDAVNGHIQLRDRVLNALVEFVPTDASQNALTTDCLRMAPSQRPKPDNPRGQAVDWGSEVFTFEISYRQRLDLALSLTATA